MYSFWRCTFYIYKLLHACSCVFRNSVCLKDNKFLVIKNKWTIEQDGCFEAESKHSFSLNIPDQICEFLIFLIEVSSDSDGPSPFSITFVISIILLECKWQTKEFGKTLRFESMKINPEALLGPMVTISNQQLHLLLFHGKWNQICNYPS